MLSLWATYVLWYQYLLKWALVLLPEATAKRVTRSALAGMWHNAINAVETHDGPYMASCDQLYAALCMQRDHKESGLLDWVNGNLPVPDAEVLAEMARLYATVFEAVHAAGLSLRERTEVWSLIRLFDPEDMTPSQLSRAMESNIPATHPLRRVVSVIELAPEIDSAVQRVAVELWEGEEQRGKAWHDHQNAEPGVEPWQK